MSKRIKGITIEIDGETKGLDKALKNVNKESKDIQKELRDVNNLLKFNPKNVELLAQKQKLLTDQVENTRKKLDQLKSAQQQVTQAFESGEISEEQYRAFQRELAATEGRLEHYEQQLRETDRTQRSFGERMAESGRTVQEFGKKMTSVGKELTMKVTAPLMAIGGVATAIGMDFKAGLSEVQAISGATAQDLENLEVKARELGSSTKFSAKEVSDGFKYMALAGWDVQQSLDGIDGVLNLAAASGEDLALVSDILTDAISAFGDEASDATRYADVLAATASNANTDVNMLGEAFKYVAPVAGALGYSLEDTSLALGLMANSGIKASSAGTALRGALTNMVSPTKSMAEEMEKLGINVLDSSGEMKPLDKLLGDLRKSFGSLTEAEQAASAATIFGKEAMAGMLALINASDKDFDKLSKSIKNSEGVAKNMADTMQNNLKGQLTNLKSALEELAIKIFDALEPALAWLLKAFQKLVDWLNGLDKKTQVAVVAIGALAAAIGPLAVVLGTILTMAGSLATTLPVLLPLISGLVAPIGLVVGALTALGVAYAVTRDSAEEQYKEQVKLAEHNLELTESYSEVLDEKIKQQEETSKLIESTKEQMQATEDLVDTFESLIEKSQLSTEEMGEFMTLQTQLEHTKSPEKIAEIEARMEELRVKSGMSAEEFEKLLSTNGMLVDQFPEAGNAVDEYGNKIADTTGKLRELTQAELDRMGLEVYDKLSEGLNKVNEDIENYKFLLGEVYTLEDAIAETNNDITLEKEKIKELDEEKAINQEEILRLQELQKEATAAEFQEHQLNIGALESKNGAIDKSIEKNKLDIEELEKAKGINEKNLALKGEQRNQVETLIDGNNTLYQQYKEMLEINYDIVIEQGKENEAIDQAIEKRNNEISALHDKIALEGDSNGEKQIAIDKLEKEKSQLDDVKTKIDKTNTSVEKQNSEYERVSEAVDKVKNRLENTNEETKKNVKSAELLNDELGEDVNKHVEIETSKDADTENQSWGKRISKTIDVITSGLGNLKFWAEGTNYHPGGPAVLGEEGPEIVKHRGKMSLATFGLYNNLPTGAQVFTNDETISMLRNGLVGGLSLGVNAQRSGGLSTISSTAPVEGNNALVGLLTEQNQLLKEMVLSNRNIERKPVLSEGDIRRSYNKLDSMHANKYDIFTGRPGGS